LHRNRFQFYKSGAKVLYFWEVATVCPKNARTRPISDKNR